MISIDIPLKYLVESGLDFMNFSSQKKPFRSAAEAPMPHEDTRWVREVELQVTHRVYASWDPPTLNDDTRPGDVNSLRTWSHGQWTSGFSQNMVMFHSYVSLPESRSSN